MRLRSAFTVLLIAGLANCAYATTIDLQNAALANPALMHGWNFEGADDTAAGADMRGLVNLVEHNNGNNHPTDPTHIVYDVPGFDTSSNAASTWRDVPGTDFQHGDAFLTDAEIAPPTAFSYEVLLKTGVVPIDGGTWDLGYILSHRPEYGPRGYFLWQGTVAGPHDPVTFPQGGAQLGSLTGRWNASDENTIVASLLPDNWYYVATCYLVDTGLLPDDQTDDTTYVDSYVADLTAGQTTLTHTSLTINGASYDYNDPGVFGVGKRFDGSAEAFPGVLDEVYLYESDLSGDTFQAHLDELLIPVAEPSTVVLLVLGALCLIPMVRRRRR